jgi:hypothetical protein
LLMSGAASGFSPSHVYMRDEIADQALVDALQEAFPEALIEHGYAVTGNGPRLAVNASFRGLARELIWPERSVERAS